MVNFSHRAHVMSRFPAKEAWAGVLPSNGDPEALRSAATTAAVASSQAGRALRAIISSCGAEGNIQSQRSRGKSWDSFGVWQMKSG